MYRFIKKRNFINENRATIENKEKQKTTGSINLDVVYFFNISLSAITTAWNFDACCFKKAKTQLLEALQSRNALVERYNRIKNEVHQSNKCLFKYPLFR